MSGVRHCTLVPFQGDLWPYLNLYETIDKFPPFSGQPTLSLSPAMRWEVGSPSSTTNLLSSLRKFPALLYSLFVLQEQALGEGM